jgi:hypothetical protein
MKIIKESKCLLAILLAYNFFSWQSALAATTETNFNWVAFTLRIPKTNFVAGEKIPVCVCVSNLVNERHVLNWFDGDPCRSGVAKFLIIDQSSGKTLDCVVPREQRGIGSGRIEELNVTASKEFFGELATNYGITNVGVYTIQAVATFPFVETWEPNFTLKTPSITISVKRMNEK